MPTRPRLHRARHRPRRRAAPRTPIDANLRELLRAGLEQAVPFNLHNDVRIREVSARCGIAELPDAEHLKNHLGTQHGGALFAAGEAAAGAAYVGAFSEHLGEIRMNAQEAHITYIRWAEGSITAKSSLKQRRREVLDALRANGRVDLPMACTLYDAENRVVAEMTFRFLLKRLAPVACSEPGAHPTGATHKTLTYP
jgi:acyl-coenzyme A thioesterase PaaI-like protein